MVTRAAGIWTSALLVGVAGLACVAGARAESDPVSGPVSGPAGATSSPVATTGAVVPQGPATPPAAGGDPDAAYWYQLPDDIDMLVTPPDINLNRGRQLWAGRAMGNASKGTKLRPAYWRAKSADGRIVNLQTGNFSFDVSGIKAGSRDLTEAANLKLMLSKLSMNAKLSASAGKGDDNPDLWQKNRAEIEMKVNAVPKTEVTFSGADEVTQTYREPGSLGVSGQRHVLQSNKREAKVSAAVAALSNVSLDVGAAGSNEVTRDTTAADRRDHIATKIENQTEEIFANLHWEPVPGLAVDAGERERNFSILWQGSETKNGSYRILEPRAAVTMNFPNAQLKASIEHAATGYNTDAFVAYARNASLTENVAVQPDRAWRFKTEWKQNVGAAQLAAAYSHESNGTVTEFGFSDSGAQVPVTTSLDKREEMNMSLSVPLEDVGLTNTSVSGDAVWRDSRVLDPVTGKFRRASGEMANRVTLRLERKLPAESMRFGLTGQMSAGQTAYQTQEISMVDASNTLGAYIAFKPGAYEVNLDVDGLVGTPKTTNYFYVDSRAQNQLPKTNIVPASGPTFKISLKRPF